MEIRQELEHLTHFLPIEKLLEKVALPIEFMPEEVTHVLPSIEVSSDGLTLARILLVADHYLCDIVIAGAQSRLEFDFIAKHSIRDYRFDVWTQELKEGDEVKASYEVARVQLLHELSQQYRTELTYAGNDRAGWLKHVVEAIPLHAIVSH